MKWAVAGIVAGMVLGGVAHAQTTVAVGVGNEGIATGVDHNRGVLTLGVGMLSREGGSDYDPYASIGGRWGDRFTVDTALDMERMHPERRAVNPNEPVDFRARMGIGWGITGRATLFGAFSRSFHNETRRGRWMVGTRLQF